MLRNILTLANGIWNIILILLQCLRHWLPSLLLSWMSSFLSNFVLQEVKTSWIFFLTTSSHPHLTAKITILNTAYGFAEATQIKQGFKHVICISRRNRLKQYYLFPCICCISSIILVILTCFHSQTWKELLYGKFYIMCLGNYCYTLTHRMENRADIGWQGSHFNVQELWFSPVFLLNIMECYAV
jgi:hypothetical protein